jgi:2-oxoisovalerate dehydrogenase E2 component (dihydrolipoyl transacylase)
VAEAAPAAGGNYAFKLPDVGEGTAEAELVAWHVKAGDSVAEDQPLAEVMTDKATVELTSPVAGRVMSTHGDIGAMAAVGSVLVYLQVEGAGNVKGGRCGAGREARRSPSVRPRGSRPAGEPRNPPAPGRGAQGRLGAQRAQQRLRHARAGTKPLARRVRKRARTRDELAVRAGRGPPAASPTRPDGFVSPAGRRARRAGGRSSLYAQRDGVEDVRVIGLRRKIAEKMQEAKRRIPHFMYAEEIDATELEALRLHLNATKKPDQPKLTLLPFFVRALVKVLPEHPSINAIYDDDNGVLHRHEAVHCGIATQTPNGLMVPVVRNAESLDVWQVATEIARVSGAAKSGKAAREELSGSTITITSLGPLGGVVHTPVINHPEVAIVGPNKIIDRPVVRGGVITVRKMMNLSSASTTASSTATTRPSSSRRSKGCWSTPRPCSWSEGGGGAH